MGLQGSQSQKDGAIINRTEQTGEEQENCVSQLQPLAALYYGDNAV